MRRWLWSYVVALANVVSIACSRWGSHRVTPSLLLFNFLLYFIQFYGFYFPDINMEVPLAVNGFLSLLLCDTNITFSLDC